MSDRDSLSVDRVYQDILRLRSSSIVAQPATDKSAVACVLWRRTDPGAIEVYMAQRALAHAFLGGYWTFPGGGIEEQDRRCVVEGEDGGRSAQVAAAVREVKEEVGVELPLDAAQYLDCGTWRTPSFWHLKVVATYLAHNYRGTAEPDVDNGDGELVCGRWISIDEALELQRQSKWMIPSPVRRVLEAMGAAFAVDDDVDQLRTRIEQQVAEEDEGPRLWSSMGGVSLCPLRTPTLPPATHTNCYLVGGDRLVVIDPGTPYPDEEAELRRALNAMVARGKEIALVCLTHHHQDHVGAAHVVASEYGVDVAAHRDTAERLAGTVPIRRLLGDGEIIDLGGGEPRPLRVLHTPGHAPGHLCFIDERSGAAAAGDMVAGVGSILIDPSEGDMAAYLGSLERLKKEQLRVLLPAHGGAIADVENRLDGYIGHRLWREQRVVAALEETGGGTPGQLVAVVYADTPVALHALAERSLLSHLAKLEGEGRAALKGTRWEPKV